MGLPSNTILDEDIKEVDILFVSDFPKMFEGEYVPFRPAEYAVISDAISKMPIDKRRVGFTSAVKCPFINKDKISSAIRKQCRTHLLNSLNEYNPKIIFLCGKMSADTFWGKQVAEDTARGVIKPYQLSDTKTTNVVSIYHPFQVVAEPKNEYLFSNDIKNAIEKILVGTSKQKININYIDTIEKLRSLQKYLFTGAYNEGSRYELRWNSIGLNFVSVDVETTGLNFLTDKIHTISITLTPRLMPLDSVSGKMLNQQEKTKSEIELTYINVNNPKQIYSEGTGEAITIPVIVATFPIDHPDGPKSNQLREDIFALIYDILKMYHAVYMQNCKFDMKFLRKYNLLPPNLMVYDTKLMQHLIREDVPKRLSDLVSYYTPNRI